MAGAQSLKPRRWLQDLNLVALNNIYGRLYKLFIVCIPIFVEFVFIYYKFIVYIFICYLNMNDSLQHYFYFISKNSTSKEP